GETSMAGARALQSGLSMVRSDVVLVHEHSVGRDLSGAGEGDAAVAFDFARYRRSAVNAARTLADLGVQIVAITDGPLSPLAAVANAWVELRVPAVGPFDSSVPAVAAAELLTARVASELGDAARERIDQLETIWQATGTFVKDD
ncbi:MAG: SIS domain-containing protein, partial [Planctomycetota bacterium]